MNIIPRKRQSLRRFFARPVKFYTNPAVFQQTIPPEYLWQIAYVHHCLIMEQIFDKRVMRDNRGYAPLHSTYLKRVMGDNYAKAIDYALRAGLLERERDGYRIGDEDRGIKGESRRYRIPDQYFGYWEQFECEGDDVADRWRNTHKDRVRKAKPTSIVRYIVEMTEFIKIDVDADTYASYGKHEQTMLDSFSEHYGLAYKVDEQGRLYTNLSVMKRCLRRHGRVNGNPLECVDIAESHANWLVMTLERENFQGNIGEYRGSIPSSSLMFPEVNKSLTPQQLSGGVLKLCPSTLRFKQLCGSGQLYRTLLAHPLFAHLTKDQFKDLYFFLMLYGPNTSDKDLLYPVIASDFPEVAAFLTAHKQGKGYKPWGKLACDMMRLEADFMLNTVANRLREQFPSMWFCPAHDAFYVEKGNGHKVKRVMEKAFAEKYMRVTLRVKDSQYEDNDAAHAYEKMVIRENKHLLKGTGLDNEKTPHADKIRYIEDELLRQCDEDGSRELQGCASED